MATANSAVSRPIDDDRSRKPQPKKKVKETTDPPEVSAVQGPPKSDTVEAMKPNFCNGNDVNNQSKGSPLTSLLASITSGDTELCSPPTGRRPSQPLLTIAEEEEVAVDPVRRGSQLESHDDDDYDKSLGDAMDTFDDVRRRRSVPRTNEDKYDDDDDDDDDDETGLTVTLTDQQDSESGDESSDNFEDREANAGAAKREADKEHYSQRRTEEVRRPTKRGDDDPKEDEGQQTERGKRKTEDRAAESEGTLKSTDAKSPARSGNATTNNAGGKVSSPVAEEDPQKRQRQKPTAAPRTTIDISADRKAVWFAAVTRGDLESVEKLIEWKPQIVNVIDEVMNVINWRLSVEEFPCRRTLHAIVMTYCETSFELYTTEI
jgi:hypothetical protein